ncbi:MAG: response regulator [Deltaproteobacteria bacterium]|nr:response regulator [Deltaproteobacteria bacterium]
MIRLEVQRLLLRATSLLVAVSSLLGLVQTLLVRGPDIGTVIGTLAVAVPLLAFVLGERGMVRAGGAVLVGAVFVLVSAITAYYGNRYPGTSTLYLLASMLAGFLVGPRSAVAVSAVAVLAMLGMAGAQLFESLPTRDVTPLYRLTTHVASLAATTGLFVIALRALRRSLDEAQQRTAELDQVRAGLEQQVAARTRSLVEARDAAMAADRAKGAFLANISHELRTPLHALLATAAELDHGDLRPDQRELVGVLRRGGDALLQIVQDLIDQARIEAGRMPIEHVAWSPRDAVADVIALQQGEADARGLRLSTQIDAAVPERVAGDPARVRQVLLNLVGNAVKFTPQGSVDVQVSQSDDDHLLFQVKDTGIGIASTDQRRLFAPFSQVDSSTTRRYGGTGLGLSISRQLVELMGGTIDLESTPGGGSTFRFTVHAPATAHEGGGAQPMPDVRGLRVLIVEDNAVNRRVAELMLARLGCDVRAVDGGNAAIDAVRAQPFDVVLLDIQMPDLDGLEVARRVRAAHGARPRIVMMTASAQPNDAEAAATAGADGFLAKPVSLQQLASALDAARAASAAATQAEARSA